MLVSRAMSGARRAPSKAVAGAPARPRARTAPVAQKKVGYHHGDLRRALVTAAIELVEERDADALTLREVASRVGVTHPAAYRHFEDKTALLAAVAEEGYAALVAELERALARERASGVAARVRALATAYVDFALRRPAQYQVMWGPRFNTDGRFPTLEAAIMRVYEVVADEVARGQREGELRAGNPRELAVGLWIVGHGYVELVARRRIRVKSRDKAIDYFLTLFQPWLDGVTRR